MRRKRDNPLQIKIRVKRLPTKPVSAKTLWGRLSEIAIGESERGLPRGWDIEISWRNPNTKQGRSKDWQTKDFETAIEESGPGFGLAVYRVIRNAMGRIPKTVKRSREFLRRSRAAKKGWKTRRGKSKMVLVSRKAKRATVRPGHRKGAK